MAPKSQTRSRQQQSAETSLDNILDNQENKDFLYVTKCLKNQPRMSAIVASMLRDGEIERALACRDQKAMRLQLGKAIGQRMKMLKHLPPRVWCTLFDDIKKIGANETFEPTEAEPPKHKEKMQWCLLALNSLEGTPIPTKHCHAEYEGPLLAVFKERVVQVGPRLDGMTWEDRNDWGWVSYDTDAPTVVTVRTFKEDPATLVVDLPYNADFMKKLNVTITMNHNLKEVCLVDHARGFSQVIWPLLQAKHPDHGLVQSTEGWELPDAANAFKHLQLPKASEELGGATQTAAASSSSGAKASTSGTAEPPALPQVKAPSGKKRKTTA